jgi:hypothetical protein
MDSLEVRKERIWEYGREKLRDLIVVSDVRIVIEGTLLRVARLEHEWDVDVNYPDALIETLQNSSTRIDLFTFTQRLPHRQPRFRFPTEWTNVAAIPISTFDEWWAQPIVKETRNKVRKSQKAGVEVRLAALDDAFVEGVRSIYDEVPLRQNKPMLHYRKDPVTLKHNLSTFLDRSDFLGAYLGGELIGFVKLVSAGSFVRTMHIMSAIRHRDKAPINALIAKAVELCAQRRAPYLVYGQFDYGKRGSRSLTEFKRYAGFQKIELPRYYIPLSVLGRVTLRLSLHHGVVDRLPQRTIDWMMTLRANWYRARYLATGVSTPNRAHGN